jgi:formate dehydrogenase maturation protein FdhE
MAEIDPIVEADTTETNGQDQDTVEDPIIFWKLFNTKSSHCRELIDAVSAENATESTAQIKEVIQDLQRFSTESTRFLPQ